MMLIVSLYLYDSLVLLYCNEGILIPAGRKWKIQFGLREPRILGKELYLPAPHIPHRPLFRLTWQFEGDTRPAKTEDWEAIRDAPWALVLPVWSMAAALFVLLPLGFFTTLGHGMLLAAISLLYVSIAAALGYLWRHRSDLRLTGRQVAKFAFEYLICPPFALNVIRTISAGRKFGEDLVSAARRTQDAGQWAATRDQLLRRLDEEIELEEAGSQRGAGMRTHRLQLMEQ